VLFFFETDDNNLSLKISVLQGRIAQAEANYLADSSMHIQVEALKTQNELLKEQTRWLLEARLMASARMSGSKLAR
jgi:hypothetical protein